jgi:cysteine-rich repeat protein
LEQKGDAFAGGANGLFNVFSNTGVFKETISTGISGYAVGCAFNMDASKLYTSVINSGKLVVFDAAHPHTIMQKIDISPGSDSSSIVFDDAANFYIAYVDNGLKIRKYNATGTLLETYSAEMEDRGSDWSYSIELDLAKDQCTLYYTTISFQVRRFNVCNNTQLPDFATLPAMHAYALRLRPPGDGTGGLLVVCSDSIKRLNGKGNVVQSYEFPGEYFWWFLRLDPDGISFWAGADTNLYRFDIASGSKIVGPIAKEKGISSLCVLGEVTAASPCGDGNLQIGEECDDGNTVNGDGCSSTCQLDTSCNITFYLYNSSSDLRVAPLTNGSTIANPPLC